jgi:hypothetical protein
MSRLLAFAMTSSTVERAFSWTTKFGQYPAKSEAGHGSEGSIADMGTYHKAIELSERHLEECHNTIQVLWLQSGGVGCRNNFLDFDTFRGGQSHSSGLGSQSLTTSPAAHEQKLLKALQGTILRSSSWRDHRCRCQQCLHQPLRPLVWLGRKLAGS